MTIDEAVKLLGDNQFEIFIDNVSSPGTRNVQGDRPQWRECLHSVGYGGHGYLVCRAPGSYPYTAR
jgi:hypothetical protein